jgi:hypothetical protein
MEPPKWQWLVRQLLEARGRPWKNHRHHRQIQQWKCLPEWDMQEEWDKKDRLNKFFRLPSFLPFRIKMVNRKKLEEANQGCHDLRLQVPTEQFLLLRILGVQDQDQQRQSNRYRHSAKSCQLVLHRDQSLNENLDSLLQQQQNSGGNILSQIACWKVLTQNYYVCSKKAIRAAVPVSQAKVPKGLFHPAILWMRRNRGEVSKRPLILAFPHPQHCRIGQAL